jgi:hypothetical protein
MAVLATGAGAVGLVLLVLFFGIPIWAIVSVIRNLRGSLRVFWIVFIAVWLFWIPLIALIVSVMYFVFKSRFVDYQRAR